MGQKVREDKIRTLSHGSGVITMAASEISPAWLTIGGQQYFITSNLSRTITLDVTLVASTNYQIFAVVSGGVPQLRISTNSDSVGPSGFTFWKTIGGFFTNTSAGFGGFNSFDVALGFISRENVKPIGMIMSSMLTESQFQAINGTGWVLTDGRSVAGTSYAAITGSNNVPDLRGMALRGKNNGRVDGNQDPDGERGLGAFQSHNFASHNHGANTATQNNDHQHIGGFAGVTATATFGVATTGVAGNINVQNGVSSDNHAITSGTTSNHTHGVPFEGGNENRMRNVAVNYFIRVN